jgi:uncharacterized RDD family membrane protein YckC
LPGVDATDLNGDERVQSATETEIRRSEAVAVGLVATGVRLASGFGRVLLLPGRVVARSFLVEPVLRSAANGLAATGREAEAGGRRRLEATAAAMMEAPETSRTVERALERAVPEVLSGEAIERLARRVLDSPAFERIVRDAAESRVARDLVEQAVHSPELQRALEEVLSGPAIQAALGRQTRTLWSEIAAQLRASTRRLDGRAEDVARSAIRRPAPTVRAGSRYSGLASRGLAAAADAGITQLAALVVGGLLGLIGSLSGVFQSGWLVATLAGTGWALLVGGYFVFFWTVAGQTPGMRLLRLRVTDGEGRAPRAARSLLRLFGAVLSIAPLGAGFLPVLFDARRRAFHDFLAGTVVVNDEDDDEPRQDVRSDGAVSAPLPPSSQRSPAPVRRSG